MSRIEPTRAGTDGATPAAINDPGFAYRPVGWFSTDGVVYTANEGHRVQ